MIRHLAQMAKRDACHPCSSSASEAVSDLSLPFNYPDTHYAHILLADGVDELKRVSFCEKVRGSESGRRGVNLEPNE